MSLINDLTNSEVLSNIDPQVQEKLNKIYYLDELIDQILKNNDFIKLIEEIFDFLKEAEIVSTKRDAKLFINNIFQKILEARKLKEEEEEKLLEGSDEEDDEEEITEGQCEMCLTRNKKITLHHAIPKLIIKRLKRKNKKVQVIYIKLCWECHAKLHSTFPHRELAKNYSTIEAILECEELEEYIKNKRVYESH